MSSTVIQTNGVNVPSHLTIDFFRRVLENGLNAKNVQIAKISFTMGSSGGDNYCSEIYRVVLTYTSAGNDTAKSVSVIVKNMPMDGEREVLKRLQVYEKEVSMYVDILPEMEKLLGNTSMLAPKCYYAVEEPVRAIVFEDLKSLGYELADRFSGLDRAHSEVLLKKIGKFHATSMLVAEKNPKLMANFKTSMLDNESDSNIKDEIFIGNCAHIADMVESWPGFENIASKLRNIKNNFKEYSLKCTKPRAEEVKVLNHGDLWVNNFMFKYGPNGPEDVVLIDMQISYYSSPGIDLNYFLNTSVQLDILKRHRYELLQTYYESFRSTLEQIGYSPIPTFEDIKNEVRAKEFYGFVAMEAVLPLISMDKDSSKDNNFETFSDSASAKKKRDIMFQTKRVQESIRYSLTRFDELGVLD